MSRRRRAAPRPREAPRPKGLRKVTGCADIGHCGDLSVTWNAAVAVVRLVVASRCTRADADRRLIRQARRELEPSGRRARLERRLHSQPLCNGRRHEPLTHRPEHLCVGRNREGRRDLADD